MRIVIALGGNALARLRDDRQDRLRRGGAWAGRTGIR